LFTAALVARWQIVAFYNYSVAAEAITRILPIFGQPTAAA
jgi:hypothetical protein